MSENIVKVEVPMGDGETLNANGRIYTKEVINKIVEYTNTKEIYLTNKKTEFDPKSPVISEEIYGVVKSAKEKDGRIELEVQCLRPETKELLEKNFYNVVPNGIGKINENKEVCNYELSFYCITDNSAFVVKPKKID